MTDKIMKLKRILFDMHYVTWTLFIIASVIYGITITPFNFNPRDSLFFIPSYLGIVIVVLTIFAIIHDLVFKYNYPLYLRMYLKIINMTNKR